MDQEIRTTRPSNQSMDSPAEVRNKLIESPEFLPFIKEEQIDRILDKLKTKLKKAQIRADIPYSINCDGFVIEVFGPSPSLDDEGNIVENPKSFLSKPLLMGIIGENHAWEVCNYVHFENYTYTDATVRIPKDTCKNEDIERELFVRKAFRKFHIKFVGQCEDEFGRTLLVYERPEMNLERIILPGREDQTPRFYPPFAMDLRYIRPLAVQLLLALNELKALNIMHTDIHPGNIMCDNMRDQTLRLDVCLAIKASDAQPGMELQTLQYRAPEILLGLPFTEAIDVWGVGCTLAFLYMGNHLFTASSEDQMVKCIVELLGQPEDHLLSSGKYTQRYFMEDGATDGPSWRLRVNRSLLSKAQSFTNSTSEKPGKENYSPHRLSCLEDLLQVHRAGCYGEFEDMIAFVDLLKQLLHVDGSRRISALEALQHPFITQDHLENHFDSGEYYSRSETILLECPGMLEYLMDKDKHRTPSQEAPVITTSHYDQTGRITLYSGSSSYSVLQALGRGSYGTVLRCQNRTTEEEVVVKIPCHPNSCPKDINVQRELSILEEISAMNPASNYMVSFIEQCEYQGQTCLVFEMLDETLCRGFSIRNDWEPCTIRPIAKQLFLALDELKDLNIMHNDIYENNIMFVNRQDEPHRIKLIDFGL